MRREIDSARLEAVLARLDARGAHYTLDLRVDTETAARILGYSPGTLRNWRSYGTRGPRWLDAGRIWYSIPDLLAWLDEHEAGDEAA